jgi:predicted phosphodiesterase
LVKKGVIRIISDVHLGDPASSVERCSQLDPLLADADVLVLNGDTLEARPTMDAPHVARHWDDLMAFCSRHEGRILLLTGNHDPAVSPYHCLDLADGLVFVTHGDVLFDDVSPWSPEAPFIGRRTRELRGALAPGDSADLETLFRISKCASQESPPHLRRRLPAPLRVLLDATGKFWPWWRVPRMFWAWHVLPARAAAFASRHRPCARIVLVGHTHRRGVWRRDGVTVVNTGSFILGLRGYVADLTDDALLLRRVTRRGHGFHAGRELRRLDLAESRQTTLAGTAEAATETST